MSSSLIYFSSLIYPLGVYAVMLHLSPLHGATVCFMQGLTHIGSCLVVYFFFPAISSW